jgi:hypothetical protein
VSVFASSPPTSMLLQHLTPPATRRMQPAATPPRCGAPACSLRSPSDPPPLPTQASPASGCRCPVSNHCCAITLIHPSARPAGPAGGAGGSPGRPPNRCRHRQARGRGAAVHRPATGASPPRVLHRQAPGAPVLATALLTALLTVAGPSALAGLLLAVTGMHSLFTSHARSHE